MGAFGVNQSLKNNRGQLRRKKLFTKTVKEKLSETNSDYYNNTKIEVISKNSTLFKNPTPILKRLWDWLK